MLALLMGWRMDRMLGILEEKNIQQGIIVFPGNMTPSARKVCSFASLATKPMRPRSSLRLGDCGHGIPIQVGGVLGVRPARKHHASYFGA